MTEPLIALGGQEYLDEHPLLTNVKDLEDVLDARLLLGEQREQLVAWLERVGLADQALAVLREQRKL
ncbi:MAG TPA: hypothetical protein VEL76_32560 [Gemmataceae bacterium]|nr:hypothetical protein [Gemmataceae bacterium]